jgi:adenosylcobinamide-GDP ribazoletransferase
MAVPIAPRPTVTVGSLTRAGDTMRAAFGLLTRLPVGTTHGTASGAAAFPVVGALVGFAGSVVLVLGVAVGEPILASLLAIAAMTVLTGALHLDGLADTADALLAPDPTRAERARKDPAVGPGGAAALILVLATEGIAIVSLAGSAGGVIAGATLVVAACVSRTLPVVAIALARPRVERAGFGGWFAARVRTSDVVIASVLAAVITVGLTAATRSVAVGAGGLVGAAIGLVLAGAVVRGRRQLDGDGMGAIVELTVAAALVAAAVVA